MPEQHLQAWACTGRKLAAMLTWLSSGWGGLTGGGCTRLVMQVSLAVVMFSASRSSSKCAYTPCLSSALQMCSTRHMLIMFKGFALKLLPSRASQHDGQLSIIYAGRLLQKTVTGVSWQRAAAESKFAFSCCDLTAAVWESPQIIRASPGAVHGGPSQAPQAALH